MLPVAGVFNLISAAAAMLLFGAETAAVEKSTPILYAPEKIENPGGAVTFT